PPPPAPHTTALPRSPSTSCPTTPAATPAPRRHLTLPHALPLPLRANTQPRHARTPPPTHARSRAPAPPACEHPASPRPHPAASSRSLTRSRSTCARTPSVTTPAPRRNLTLAHALTLAVPGTPDVASSRSLISSPGASARHAPRSRGSRTSRRASPSRFEPN